MAKRGVIIGIGTVVLVVGLVGLGLLQTGVIFPTEPVSMSGVKQSEQAARSTQGSREPGNQTAQQLTPGSQNGGTPPEGGLKQAPGQIGQQASSEEPAPVPQAGKSERRYTQQDQPAPFQSAAPQTTGGPSSQARKQKFDKNRLRALLKSGSKHYAGNTDTKHHVRKGTPANSAEPVVIRFNFDPAHARRLNVARVHLGDRIRVYVQQVGPVDRRVYFTFSESLNSTQGAVLELETMRWFEPPVMYRPVQGYYVIEIRIYPNNRWNIPPRSFV